MTNPKIITCAFCQGTGNHPHFGGTCPVCKGKGKNIITGPFLSCRDCRGTGQKRGTTLTCYSCDGFGVVPDTSKIFKKAKKEIKKAREEMDREREELREKTQPTPLGPTSPKDPPKKQTGDEEEENPKGKLFCQCCGNKILQSSTIKVCLDCAKKIKDL